MSDKRWFATCPKGLENLVSQELTSLGATQTRETVGGCRFQGSLAVAYRSCMWSRLANRILLPLAEFPVSDSASLHAGVLAVEWDEVLTPGSSLIVDFTGQNREIRNTQYGAQVTKDAIVDFYRQRSATRPDVARRNADVRINLRLRHGKATLAVDFGGCSLHERGYRLEAGKAPLKENLAAALLIRADWPGIAARGGALIDPMCGSATLLLEGALMVADIAPGLKRERWGFEHLCLHNPSQWQAIRTDAEARAARGRNRELPEIRGYDADLRVIRKAQANIDRADLHGVVRVSCKPLVELRKPTHKVLQPGLLLCNPPYGERLGDKASLQSLYRQLGETMAAEFSGWQAGVFTSDKDLGRATGLRSHKQYPLWNGSLSAHLLLFNLNPDNRLQQRTAEATSTPAGGAVLAAPVQEAELSSGADMFAHRLRKNLRKTERWARREGISCYRLYDADMPEYAVAIDRYGDALHVAEYQAPKAVAAADAERRLQEVAQVLPLVTGIPAERTFFKQRARQRGKAQYQRAAHTSALREVQEGPVKLLVNLADFLDTGLFLDHRLLRKRIAAEAQGKQVLNLFCYTASISVHAAVAGAQTTTSVDMSKTYLDWARKNLALNGYDGSQHQLIQADCLSWLERESRRYDLIVLDPPSFSNSKRMSDSFDVQRDHLELLRKCVDRLNPDGVLYFSNNLRSFKLDPGVASFCHSVDITSSTIDFDFKRRRNIHHCWRITL